MQIVLRAAALYLFVWLVMRASGRKELGQITAFELVIMVVLGDLIQQGVTGDDRSVVGAMLAVATFALLTVGVSYLSFRVPALRPTLEGIPVVIVRDGRLLEETLRIERLTPEEVLEQARKQGIADLAQVALGVLESDGAFSFVKRQDAG